MNRTLARRFDLIRRSYQPTPTVPLPDDDLDLHLKLEYTNSHGSAKDRAALWILRQALERGEIDVGTTVVESSSGNFAVALASICRSLGVAFIPVLDPNVNASTETLLRTLCDRVEKVDAPDGAGGYLEARLARVRRLRAELPDVYWTNQYGNVDAVEGHYRLTGGELRQALHRIDYLFVGVGTAATIAGLSLRVKERSPRTRVVAVDAEGSVTFGGPAARRRIPGIGSAIGAPLLRHALIDDVVIVPELDAARGCHELLRRYGVFAGGSTGSVYAAIRSYFRDHPHPHRPTVAFLAVDRGTGYADTVYNPDWVRRFLGGDAEPAGVAQLASA
ncbi:2,3-diaminopropionate biosynthesis protein SbnA [Catellatospora bangladeshensis]|uniref:2,3-diaminopropionate biosynthesis protein SbnA n=1 Tax=Catellatospora bangladeshensis TaxID=310355 RepID=A0A8J3NN13_9ACTN|nr:2,3-diaminopropionate biosynthesis protein SbnA [Catellatospora bangladeshensis]GIF85811.1 2,3-diaminopropionate biosynthesis protein SbnA [Catellatospora bangladeshensis]